MRFRWASKPTDITGGAHPFRVASNFDGLSPEQISLVWWQDMTWGPIAWPESRLLLVDPTGFFTCIHIKNGGFHSHRGTPSHHPFFRGIFHEINQPANLWLAPMTMETAISPCFMLVKFQDASSFQCQSLVDFASDAFWNPPLFEKPLHYGGL